MARRDLLHKSKLEEFKAWLTDRGIEHRPGRGEWQALQVKLPSGPQWHVIFFRIDMAEHFTVSSALVRHTRAFIDHMKLQETGVRVIGPNVDHFKYPRYMTTTHGMSGFFAVEVWWNEPDGGFWEPYDTGIGRYKSKDEAFDEAVEMARENQIPIVIGAPE